MTGMKMLPYKRPESVLVVIHTKALFLVLQKRSWPQFWQSVTGSLDWEETDPQQTAWRELFEETGLGPPDGKLMDAKVQNTFQIYPHWQHRYQPGVVDNLEYVFCFFCSSQPKIRLSEEHLDFCWLPREAAINKVTSPSNKEAIRQCMKRSEYGRS